MKLECKVVELQQLYASPKELAKAYSLGHTHVYGLLQKQAPCPADVRVREIREPAAKSEVNTMLVTTKDYSTHVGLPIRTLRRWCRSGVVPAIQVGRTYYLDPDKADQAIADMKVTAERPKANVEPKKSTPA